jgi:hypothetical protein
MVGLWFLVGWILMGLMMTDCDTSVTLALQLLFVLLLYEGSVTT